MLRITFLAVFWCAAIFHGGCDVAAAGGDASGNSQVIVANDNRSPGGSLRGGVLTIRLEAKTGVWYPEAENGQGLEMQAFSEEGRPAQIPGPLIRVKQGTEIHITVRNSIPSASLVVHGLHTRPGNPDGTLPIAPGAIRDVRFRAGAAGTYYYWATTTGIPLEERGGVDSQLSGALIVDPPGGKLTPDRVFVIGWWSDAAGMNKNLFLGRNAIVINGKSWPHTERLTYTQGESVHWRWINASFGNHPMHLHGFYYRVESRGDGERDHLFTSKDQRRVVTELMEPGTTMSLTWLAERPGNWVFHCHVIPHIYPGLRLGPSRRLAGHDPAQHALEGMAGLVLGVHVLPAGFRGIRGSPPASPRRIQLVAQLQSGRYGKDPEFGFAVLESSGQAESAAAQIPGPPIVLIRGQPVSITVVNRLPEPTTVHWHGIELESYYDGIAGWSGSPGHIAPLIQPGGSFVAEFVPRRAGTFIYHTHMDDIHQLSAGLYGPLIVLDPGQAFNPATDRILLLSVQGPSDNTPILLNASPEPTAIDLKAGTKYRLRFINITPHDPLLRVSLLSNGLPVSWRPLAKDGADVPPSQVTLRSARQIVSVGETYDFEFEPRSAGDLRLEIFRPARSAIPESRMEVAVQVR